MMRILIGCETSGIGRRAFAALGHDVWSCDLEPAEDRSSRFFPGLAAAMAEQWAGPTPDQIRRHA